MTKAVILLVPDDAADEIGRLIASTLSLNGYGTRLASLTGLLVNPNRGRR